MYLVKDAESYNGIVTYAFRHVHNSWEIAVFDTRDEAVKAVEAAHEHDGGDYLPIILEIVTQ